MWCHWHVICLWFIVLSSISCPVILIFHLAKFEILIKFLKLILGLRFRYERSSTAFLTFLRYDWFLLRIVVLWLVSVQCLNLWLIKFWGISTIFSKRAYTLMALYKIDGISVAFVISLLVNCHVLKVLSINWYISVHIR